MTFGRSSTIASLAAILILTAGPAEAVRGRPRPGYRPPVIEKVQIVFSMVSHHSHIASRVNYYNTVASPQGNTNYAVPHLVYEPRVTLHNPYEDELTLDHVRIRIWDPPVGFRFRKNGHLLRSSWEDGSFDGLAQFQIANEVNPNARKTFTLLLRTSENGLTPDQPITLQPGESRTFAAWTDPEWTWQLETGSGSSSRSFFDWDESSDLTNRDGRTSNDMGVEASQDPDDRAGFQTDGLSSHSARPTSTRYDFEIATGQSGNWVAIKLEDTVTVESRAMRRVASSGEPSFRISLLGGYIADPERDNYQELTFSLDPLVQPPTGSDTEASVTRTWAAGDLLQSPDDTTPGGKSPFAVLTAIAKPVSITDGSLTQIADLDGNEHYDLRFDPVSGFDEIPTIGNLGTEPEAPAILGVERTGNELRIDFTVPSGATALRAMGGTTPAEFPDDLSNISTILPATGGASANHWTAIIDITSTGPTYFVRIEEVDP